MKVQRPLFLSLASVALITVVGCAEGSGGSDFDMTARQNPGAMGLSQPGAQDFGLFRQILDRGEIPAPEILDDLGFFAEHKLDYPAPDCGDELCVHASLGVRGDLITGASSTVLQIGLSSPIDLDSLERPPLDLVVAVDVSGSMTGAPIEAVRAGLSRMLDYLEEGDRVSIVTYNTSALVLVDALGLEAQGELEVAIAGLKTSGKTDLYDGLFTAFQLAEAQQEAAREVRVVFLSDGEATTGLQSPAKLRHLAESYASEGIGLTTIGVGRSFDVEVMRSLAEVGAGNFYFLDDPQAVREVFTEEVQTFLYPVALDVELRVETGLGYAVRGVYGTHGWRGGASGGVIRVPSLYLAGRTSAQAPSEGGRRGGGGAILLELAPRLLADLSRVSPEALARVGQIELSWTDPRRGERVSQHVDVDYAYEPGEYPEGGWFSDPTVDKGFVMLNLFAGFSMAAQLVRDRDAGAALAVLGALHERASRWLDRHTDPDIEDDLVYVSRFIENLRRLSSSAPPAR